MGVFCSYFRRVICISYELHSHRFEESIIWTGCIVTDKTSVHIV